MKILRLKFIGEPVPKRPNQPFLQGGKARSYQPAKTGNAIKDLRAQMVSQLPKDWTPMEGPIHAKVIFYRVKPTTDPRRLWPYSRPDLDNYQKLLWDALNTTAFEDDGQLCHVEAVKMFGIPSIEVVLTEMESHAPKAPRRKRA